MDEFEIEVVERTPERARLRAAVPLDLRYFEGHFEGNPMLPGVAQLVALAHARARSLFAPLGPERRIARVKFEAVIRPGDHLDVLLERSTTAAGETHVRFEITRDATRCASGAIVYGPER